MIHLIVVRLGQIWVVVAHWGRIIKQVIGALNVYRMCHVLSVVVMYVPDTEKWTVVMIMCIVNVYGI